MKEFDTSFQRLAGGRPGFTTRQGPWCSNAMPAAWQAYLYAAMGVMSGASGTVGV